MLAKQHHPDHLTVRRKKETGKNNGRITEAYKTVLSEIYYFRQFCQSMRRQMIVMRL